MMMLLKNNILLQVLNGMVFRLQLSMNEAKDKGEFALTPDILLLCKTITKCLRFNELNLVPGRNQMMLKVSENTLKQEQVNSQVEGFCSVETLLILVKSLKQEEKACDVGMGLVA